MPKALFPVEKYFYCLGRGTCKRKHASPRLSRSFFIPFYWFAMANFASYEPDCISPEIRLYVNGGM